MILGSYKLNIVSFGAVAPVDVSQYVGNLTWSDTDDSLGMELSFDIAGIKLNVGDRFQLINGSTDIMRGVLTDESFGVNKVYSYTGFDLGFFLNKNEVIRQFNGVYAHDAIKQLLNSVGIPTGSVASMPVRITQIYKDKVVSDVIKDILDQVRKVTGRKYRIECQHGIVEIKPLVELKVNAYSSLSGGVQFLVQELAGGFSATNSMQDMKNSIIVSSNKEDNVAVRARQADNANIMRYGLLQQVELLDDEEKTSPGQIARTLLAELNKIKKIRNVELLGSDLVRSGRILTFDYPELDFKGDFKVSSCKHTLSGGVHKMSLGLDDYDGQ